MSSGLRERKKGADSKTEPQVGHEEDKKKEEGPVDLEPDFKVALAIVLSLFALLGIFVYYKIDNRDDGPFATIINANIVDPIMRRLPDLDNRYQKKGL